MQRFVGGHPLVHRADAQVRLKIEKSKSIRTRGILRPAEDRVPVCPKNDRVGTGYLNSGLRFLAFAQLLHILKEL